MGIRRRTGRISSRTPLRKAGRPIGQGVGAGQTIATATAVRPGTTCTAGSSRRSARASGPSTPTSARPSSMPGWPNGWVTGPRSWWAGRAGRSSSPRTLPKGIGGGPSGAGARKATRSSGSGAGTARRSGSAPRHAPSAATTAGSTGRWESSPTSPSAGGPTRRCAGASARPDCWPTPCPTSSGRRPVRARSTTSTADGTSTPACRPRRRSRGWAGGPRSTPTTSGGCWTCATRRSRSARASRPTSGCATARGITAGTWSARCRCATNRAR